MNTIYAGAATMAMGFALATAGAHALESETRERVRVRGPATVIDANHLEVEGHVLRLWAMEAPSDEWCTRPPASKGCAARAAQTLRDIIGDSEVDCIEYLPFTAAAATPTVLCQRLKEGEDPLPTSKMSTVWVNWAMVNRGWAVSHPWIRNRSKPTNVMGRSEAKARKRNRGMWRHDPVIPDDALTRTMNPEWIEGTGPAIRGMALARSGDELLVDGRTIALAGIERSKPEWCTGDGNRSCERRSRMALRKLVRTEQVICIPEAVGEEDPETLTAFCTTNPATEPCDRRECWINWQIVREGHAIASRQWMDEHPIVNALIEAEDLAIREGKGLWHGTVPLAKMEHEGMTLPYHSPGEATTVKGEARVVGPESIEVDGRKIYLYGVHGARQEWCSAARRSECSRGPEGTLSELIGEEPVECTWLERKGFNTPLRAVCIAGDEAQKGCTRVECSLNGRLVESGWGVQFAFSSFVHQNDRLMQGLVQAERAAREAKQGIWAGMVQLPGYLERMRGGTRDGQ